MDNQNRDQNVGGGAQQDKGGNRPETGKDWNQGGSQQQPGRNNPSQGGDSQDIEQSDFGRGGSQGQGSGSGPNR